MFFRFLMQRLVCIELYREVSMLSDYQKRVRGVFMFLMYLGASERYLCLPFT